MSAVDWLAPLATVGLAVFGTYAGPLGTFLAEKTHNERLGRIVGAAGRLAGDTADALSKLPAGSNLDAVKAQMFGSAVAQIKTEFARSVKGVGGDDTKLLNIVQGEFNKLPPRVAGLAAGVVVPAAAVSEVTPSAKPQGSPVNRG